MLFFNDLEPQNAGPVGVKRDLDVARCYLWLFTLYINIKIVKNSC